MALRNSLQNQIGNPRKITAGKKGFNLSPKDHVSGRRKYGCKTELHNRLTVLKMGTCILLNHRTDTLEHELFIRPVSGTREEANPS